MVTQSIEDVLGLELGELFDQDLLMWGGDEADEDDDDDSVSSVSTSNSGLAGPLAGLSGARRAAVAAVAAAAGYGGAAADGWGGGGGGGGGVRDSAAAMVFQPRRLKALKRRYDQLLRISLQVWLPTVVGGVSGFVCLFGGEVAACCGGCCLCGECMMLL